VRTEAGNLGLWGVDLDSDLGVKRNGNLLDGIVGEVLFSLAMIENIRRVYVQGKWVVVQKEDSRWCHYNAYPSTKSYMLFKKDIPCMHGIYW